MKGVHILFGHSKQFAIKKAWVLDSALPGIGCMIPGKSFSFSGPLFTQIKNEGMDKINSDIKFGVFCSAGKMFQKL